MAHQVRLVSSLGGKLSETCNGVNILWTYLEYLSVTMKEHKNRSGMYDIFHGLSSKCELFVTQEFYEFRCFLFGKPSVQPTLNVCYEYWKFVSCG